MSPIRHTRVLIGGAVICLLVLTAIFAPFIAPYDPAKQDVAQRLLPPGSNGHELGTDALGRDLLSRIIFGSRISVIVGVAAVTLAGTVGTILGLVSGYFGGWVDAVVMRLADAQLAVPFLVLASAAAVVTGPGVAKIIVILGLAGWVLYGRIVRSEVLVLREREFVQAARALGGRPGRIIVRHILPNVTASIVVVATLQVGSMILSEASLSFLGLGVPISVPTWGSIAADGRDYLETAWWVSTFPGLAILLTVLGTNFVGDWLRDRWDPRLRV